MIYGRDFTGTVALESDGSGDTLIGNGADEGIIGGAGSDFLDGTAYSVVGFTNSESTLTGFVFLELGVGSDLPVVRSDRREAANERASS